MKKYTNSRNVHEASNIGQKIICSYESKNDAIGKKAIKQAFNFMKESKGKSVNNSSGLIFRRIRGKRVAIKVKNRE